jgi:hydrogenase maturation protein HypF
MSERVRKAIDVTGIVQGVGFRPYVYRLAFARHLAGFITNTAAGVSIEVEGPADAVDDFICKLPAEAPPLARITQMAAHDIPARADGDFRILPSRPGENRRVLISPDVAICDDCLRELFDRSDRRFHYPFINCTNCGPRYTIVRDIPYDRARTSMAVFPMCADCQREYDHPLNRRFHAQPNACWKCGPQVELWDGEGKPVESADPVAEAAARLQAGYVVAVKGLGGFHLAVDATNSAAVRRLREGKRRVEKPFAIMASSLDAVRNFCQLDDASRALLSSPERPIVLLRRKSVSPIRAVQISESHSSAQRGSAAPACGKPPAFRPMLNRSSSSTPAGRPSLPDGAEEVGRDARLSERQSLSARQTAEPQLIADSIEGYLDEPAISIAELVAPFNREYGVFLPYTPLHYLLFAAGRFQALVMTSGNISEEPIAIDNAEAVARLHGIADFFLVHNRDVLLRCDDSVVRVSSVAQAPAFEVCGASLSANAEEVHQKARRSQRRSLSASQAAELRTGWSRAEPQVVVNRIDRNLGKPGHRQVVQLIRRSRGYVPVPVFLNEDLPPILAVGGELKNTVCLTKGRHAFLSQHIGDLENLESYSFFETTISSFKRILEVEPQLLAYDLHPDYFSTRWALGQTGLERVGVQHHHAHIASCMAENHLDGKVIGIALDGTGYGTDGAVWGGEVLLATYADFERSAHLDYVPMPGGAAAITEPWRMAVSYLHKHFGEAFLDLDIPFVRELDVGAHRNAPLRRQVAVLVRMAERGVNAPLTSSCGRLYDAVSALAGIRKRVNYEAQAAIELEAAIAGDGEGAGYPFELRPDGSGWVIDTRPLFAALVDDLKRSAPVGTVSRRFHEGFADVLARAAELIHAKTGLQNVCLSGGSFQNVFLLEYLKRKLEADGLNVFTHSEVPCGDGGLSMGQALVAAHRQS